nr:hypothetical protein [Tanacetum cinerariifolium]
MSIQDMEVQKQQECEIKIDELKDNFNKISIEIEKITKEKELRQREQAANLSTYTAEPSRRFNFIFYDDDDEHYPKKESDEVIKSSVDDLVPTQVSPRIHPGVIVSVICLRVMISLSTDIPERKSVTFSNPLFDSNDNFTSSDDDSLSDEDVPEDNVKIYSNSLFEFDEEYISSNVNPIFDEVLEYIKSKALLVTPLFDSYEDECFDSGGDVDEINAFDNPLDFEDGYYDSDGDVIYLESLLSDDTTLNLPPEDRHYLSLTYVIRMFLPYFTYPVNSPFLFSSKSEDTIFDPGISAFHFSSLELMASHRGGTFMCYNVYLNILNESPMEICFSTLFNHNITKIWEIPYGESKVHIEVLSVLWGNRLSIWTVHDRCLEANEEMMKGYKAIKEKSDPGREQVKLVHHNVSMLNHSEAEPMGVIKDVLFQVGITTVLARKSKILRKTMKYAGFSMKTGALSEKCRKYAALLMKNKAAKTRYNTNLARLLPKQIYSPYVVDWGLLNTMGCAEEIEAMLEIKKMITYGVYQITTRYNKVQRNKLWLMSEFEAKHSNGYANVDWLMARWFKRNGVGSQRDSMICAGSESRPPMLNKENYVPWSSRLLRYAKSIPNGKLIHNSILNSPYVRRMIPEPGDANREVTVTETFHLQIDDELSDKELKQIEADDQVIQTILLGLPEDIYVVVDSCETAQEIGLRVQQMMKGYNIGIQEKKAKLFNEWERNKYFPEKIASNLKFLNNLQPEWSRHVTIVHQTKDLHTADYTQLYDFMKYNQKEVDELKAERLAKTQYPLALMANSNNPYAFPAPHQDQSSFNQNYLQQPMPNPEDITDPTTAMNMALVDQNPRVQNIGNQNGLIGVQGNENHNQIGNGNLVTTSAEGNAAGQNGNQIRCYNCRGVGHYARNYTVRPRRRGDAYLQTQLLIAHKEEAGIQLHAEEYDLMAAATDLDEIEEVNANCILMANLQQASTSGTQTYSAPVYDSDGLAEVHENCDDNEIFNMSTQEEQYTELLEPIPESHQEPQNDNDVISEDTSMEQDLNKQLSKEKSTVSFLLEEKKRLKSDFKTREDELLDKQIQLEKKIKELNNILLKMCQSIQTIHMLSPKLDSFYHTEQKMALGYKNPFYLKQAQKKQQSLYDGKVLLEKHDHPVVHDSEETLQLAQESCEKMKQLNIEIKPANYIKINHLSGVFVPQKAMSHEELYILNNSKTTNVSKSISIPNDDFLNDTTPSVARKFLNEVKSTIVALQRVVKHRMTIETHNWSSSAHQELHKIVRDKIFPIVNQVDARVQNFKIQFLKEAAKFVGDFKSLANEADASLAKHKVLELEIERLLKAVDSSKNTKFVKQPIVENLPKVGETNALSKSVTSNLASTPQESKGVNNDKVIALGMFRINPLRLLRKQSMCLTQLFDQEGKIVDSSESDSQSDCVNGDNACTFNSLEPKIKRFPNSTSLLDRLFRFVYGTVHFGNDHVVAILGFGQFCDSDLEVAFRRNACFVINLEGVDLLKGDRSTNLYTINLHAMASASPICLMARASSTKSWLWHHRLSHLNFDTINDLARNDLVAGLLKFKYHKEHLCPLCEQGKSKRASHPPKPVLNSRQRLHLLHMDLC